MYVPRQPSKPDNDALGANVFNNENLTPRCRLVYGVLTKYCGMSRTCVVSHTMLMKEFGGSRSMIARAVRELEVEGIITRQRGSREVRYRLLK
jgi:DNA-binding transcriptional regulator PaaX